MGAREFGLWVDHEMRERQIGASKLAARVGELPDGRVLDATGVRLIRQGRREKYDTELVRRIARALNMDEDEAYWTAGVWPAPLDLADYRRLKELAATPANGVSARKVAQPLPLDVDPGEFAQLIDSNRPRLAVVVPLEPRRDRRQEDRRLHLVRPVVAEQVPA